MSIEINIPPLLQAMAGGVKQVTVRGDTIGVCLKDLIKKYPQLKSKLFTADGTLNKGINFFVNGKSTFPAGLEYNIREGDQIYITYVILGG